MAWSVWASKARAVGSDLEVSEATLLLQHAEVELTLKGDPSALMELAAALNRGTVAIVCAALVTPGQKRV